MKLLKTDTFARVFFVERPPSEYAVLSYTWSQSDDITYQDIGHISPDAVIENDWKNRHPAGFSRVVQACHRARAQNIDYLWVDALCVDKSSSADVVQSVTASFDLIWDAAVCIVHLSDLLPVTGNEETPAELEKALSGCRWFTRGWTLQELVASQHVEFFDRDWNIRCVKAPDSPWSWFTILSRVSGVDASVLSNRNNIFNVSLGRRLSWAADRETSWPEDAAYSLMGICGVSSHLSPRYGEGRRSAFHRMQEKILERSIDLSILAWKRLQINDSGDKGNNRQHKKQVPVSGILADSVVDFRHFGSHVTWVAPFRSKCHLAWSNHGLCIWAFLSAVKNQEGASREVVLILNAAWLNEVESASIGILLREVEAGQFVRSDPENIVCLSPRKDDITLGRVCVYRIVDDQEAERMFAKQNELRISAWMRDTLGRK
jgi:hypothetical protein